MTTEALDIIRIVKAMLKYNVVQGYISVAYWSARKHG
jgi:hypothetical protein